MLALSASSCPVATRSNLAYKASVLTPCTPFTLSGMAAGRHLSKAVRHLPAGASSVAVGFTGARGGAGSRRYALNLVKSDTCNRRTLAAEPPFLLHFPDEPG